MMRKNAILVIDALFGLQDPVAQEVLAANGYAPGVEIGQIDNDTLQTIAVRCHEAHLSTQLLLEDPSG